MSIERLRTCWAIAAVVAATLLCRSAALAVEAPPFAGVADQVFNDAASPVVVRAGQLFVIVLDANPSTGYHWKATSDPDGGVATLRGTTFLPSAAGMMGAPGKELRIYEAVGPGTTTIPLSYVPPGTGGSGANGGNAARHLTFKLTVTPVDAG